jgi:two-component system, LuxR family, sensor kinase FixL
MNAVVRIGITMQPYSKTLLGGFAFVVVYVLLDWASYLHPMYGLNITPWNPSLALGLVIWFRIGKLVAIPWFAAILIGEVLVRNLPATLPLTIALTGVLTLGYGIMAEVLRRHADGEILHDRRRLLSWLIIVVAGTLVTSCIYISLLFVSGLIPIGDWSVALVRFWVGDCVGIVVTMPFFWLLLDSRTRLQALCNRWETAGYAVLAIAVLWISFGLGGEGEFQYFYLLFLPLVWAAARQGVPGAAIAAFILQAGIIVAVQWQNLVAVTVFELQLLGAVLAFVGLFIGAVVDEKQRVSNELRQTLRLAAAGEMAAALAHELNQPLTALSAYGSACRQMLEQGGNEERLRETISRMITESYRAADVVRRLRDFFRTGATRLERIALGRLIDYALTQIEDKVVLQGVELVIATMPDCTLLADRLQVEVVLRNLLANATDAVLERPAGQRRISIAAELVDGDTVHIRVEDSGLGLTAAKVSRLFEAFQSSKSSGMGLGLAISRAIAQAHGGDLIAEAGDGGVFVLVLPIEGDIHVAA